MEDTYYSNTIDDAMRPYLSSIEYRVQRRDINEDIRHFRATLSADQGREFNRLMDNIYAADNRMTEEAYKAGFANGVGVERAS